MVGAVQEKGGKVALEPAARYAQPTRGWLLGVNSSFKQMPLDAY